MKQAQTIETLKRTLAEPIDEDLILEKALEGYVPGSWESVVFFDPETGEYTAETWSSNTYLNPESCLIEVYRLRNIEFPEVNDILSDEEYEKLIKAVMKRDDLDYDEAVSEIDHEDQETLDLIGVNLQERQLASLKFYADDDSQLESVRSVLELELERLEYIASQEKEAEEDD